MAVFYRLNGFRLVMSDIDLVQLSVDVATGRLDVGDIAKTLAQGGAEPDPPESIDDDDEAGW
jgi:hypothetical protein